MNIEPIECYVMNLNTDDVVTFNVEIPENVTESYTANYTDQFTRGRSTPFKSYENSGPHSIQFSVKLVLDYRRDLVDTVDCLKDMLKPVKGVALVPPKVRVRIGSVLNIQAVPTGFEFNWGDGYKDGVYRTCECSFGFDEVEDVGIFAEAKGKDYKAVVPAKSYTVTSRLATNYQYGQEYELKETKTGYYTAEEALANKSNGNPTGTCEPGLYYIYNKSKGMINITKVKGQPGSWINP